ncbi:TetR/AcrR family transcriptional regulator [Candidatus Thorarchaeota archaeon]|nr:MAG: TetR/AcrR family transcriptional regulator [Candidatus Thorarchaeota archaeon]
MATLSPREKEIITASHDLFTRFGFSKTTMEDIGKEVGLNQASLYHYFRNKEEIFLNVILDQISKLRAAIQMAMRDVNGLEQRLVAFYKAKFRFLQDDTLLGQVIQLDRKKISPETKKRIQKVWSNEKEFVAAVIQNAIDNDEVPEIDTLRTAQVIINITEGIRFTQARQSLMDDKERSSKEIETELEYAISLFVNGIKQTKR